MNKPLDQTQFSRPWEAAGVSRSTWFRHQKYGARKRGDALRIVFNATDEEDLRQDWANGVLVNDIATAFGVSIDVLYREIRRLGLPPRVSYNPWLEQDDAILRELYGKLTTKKIAKRLKRTNGAIISRIHRLGLSLTKMAVAA
jgi:hypothetical protein